MANYKRGKCRRNAMHAMRGSEASWRARVGMKPIRLPSVENWPDRYSSEWDEFWRFGNRDVYHWTRRYPAWWDREFHTRPHRANTRRLEKKVMKGADPDEVVWPLAKKPHNYYW
jgi:hypothetical protein